MADVQLPVPSLTDTPTSRRMAAQRRRDTNPELLVRRLLHARGLRFRVDKPLEGLPRRRADITFPRARVVVFIDGCFWHACPVHATTPKRNELWWARKLAANTARDRQTDDHLRDLGWQVLRFWEHEDPQVAATVIEAAIRRPSTS